MTTLPALKTDPLPSTNPTALYDPGIIRMIDPLYQNADGWVTNMLGGGNGGAGEIKTMQMLYGTNTVRLGVNPVQPDIAEHLGWTKGDEGYSPEARESMQFLIDAGCKILWLHADDANGISQAPDGTNAEKVETLTTVTLERCLQGFRNLRKVLATDTALRDATIGLELFNEPAIYNIYKGQMTDDPVYGQRGYFEHLYADHIIAVVKEIKEWWKGQIQIPLFRYNASAMDLTVRRNGVSALDRIRWAVGADQLVWSIHAYPSWVLPVANAESAIGSFRKIFAPLGNDRKCLTEVNVGGITIADEPPELPTLPYYLHGLLWARRNNVGVGYFPVHNTGSASPFSFYANGDGQLTHMWAFAEILRLWNGRNELDPITTPNQEINVIADWRDIEGLTQGTTVAEAFRTVIRGAPGTTTGDANVFNVILGNPNGGDILRGALNTRNFLAAYRGNNTIETRGTMDVARGGTGHDTFNLLGGAALVEGGQGVLGSSTVNVQAGKAVIYTGSGPCVMNFSATGQEQEIRDLKASDTIDLTAWPMAATVEAQGADVVISTGDETITCLGRSLAFVTACIIGNT